jgi:biopolymer transport protein TolQ
MVSTSSAAKEEIPSARIFAAAVGEWRNSTRTRTVDREGTRDRLSTAMSSAVGQEGGCAGGPAQYIGDRRCGGAVRRLVRHRLGHHAYAFRSHGQRSSTAPWPPVAPGIAEALIATAIGLFAAIPAVDRLQPLFAPTSTSLASRFSKVSLDGLYSNIFQRQSS